MGTEKKKSTLNRWVDSAMSAAASKDKKKEDKTASKEDKDKKD